MFLETFGIPIANIFLQLQIRKRFSEISAHNKPDHMISVYHTEAEA